MLTLVIFITLALLTAGLFAVTHGDTLVVLTLLVVLALAIIADVPHMRLLQSEAQQVIGTMLPLARH